MQENHFAVAALGRKDGLQVKKYGFTKKVNNVVEYNFPDGAPGDSGGVIATPDFEIMALLRGKILGYQNGDGSLCEYRGLYPIVTVSIFKALELIDFYKRRLESRL